MINTIKLKDVLIFPGEHVFPIAPLTVIIGQNGSGKSLLIRAIESLSTPARALPRYEDSKEGYVEAHLSWDKQIRVTTTSGGSTTSGWALGGRVLTYRIPQAPERGVCSHVLHGDWLEPDLSNLPARILQIQAHPPSREVFARNMQALLPGKEVRIQVDNKLKLLVDEEPYMSGGVYRLLVLATALTLPRSEDILIFEEPDAGIHIESLRHITRLMLETSKRAQILFTTHSPFMLEDLDDEGLPSADPPFRILEMKAQGAINEDH
jgi:predicted ATPase